MSLISRNPFDLTLITSGKLDQNQLRRIDALNPDISLAVPGAFRDVWFANQVLEWPQVAQKINLVSDDARDADGQLGTQAIFVNGLDANHVEIDEVVFLDGTNTVQTVNEYLRLNQAATVFPGQFVDPPNFYGHFGTITLTGDTEGMILGQIGFDPVSGVGYGRTMNSHFTVPVGTIGYILDMKAGTNSNMNFRLNFFGRNEDTGGAVFTIEEAEIISGSGQTELGALLPIVIPARSDLWASIIHLLGNPMGRVTFGYNILVVKQANL